MYVKVWITAGLKLLCHLICLHEGSLVMKAVEPICDLLCYCHCFSLQWLHCYTLLHVVQYCSV